MKSIAFLAVCVALVLMRCSTPQISGGTTDTGNVRVSAVMYHFDGSFAAGASVKMRPEDYLVDSDTLSNKNDLRETVTDSDGHFQFDSITGGSYCIEINDGKEAAFLFRIIIDSVNEYRKDTVLSGTLKPYAKVEGNVNIHDPVDHLYCLVYGLERKVPVDSSGNFVIDNLPEGTYNFKIVSDSSTFKPIHINDIKATSGSETRISNVTPGFSKRIILNTAASGAAINGRVTGFPVLIRLNSTNFNFDSSAADGSDIRFTDSNGKPLSYEIERWDNSAKEAEVWVKVDTINGNDSTQYISMFWGASTETGSEGERAGGSAVFDTADGFQGVWHFSGMGSKVADATQNHFDGSANEVWPVAGLIGSSGEYDGKKSYLTMSGTANGKLNFGETDTYTVSVWIYSYDFTTDRYLVGKGNNQYDLKIKDQQICFTQYSSREARGTQSLSSPPARFQWCHLTAVRKGSSQYLYVNGVCTDSSAKVISAVSTGNTSNDFEAGVQSDLSSTLETYYGKIDEIRICNRAMSPDWIKLCFMNQKESDLLVLFK